jgi:hypothetical protein
MTSSLRGALDVGRELIDDLKHGHYGYCGTGPRDRLEPQEIHGVWVYRVKPTGPIERAGKGVWTTSFPVRVLEIVRELGEPARNKLALPLRRSTQDAAGAFDFYDPVGILRAYGSGPTVEERLAALGQEVLGGPREASEIEQILSSCPEAERAEAASAWCHRKMEEQTARLEKQRRDEHHKLRPDPRYRRDGSWRRALEE